MKIEAMLWIVVLALVALSLLFPKARVFSFSAIGLVIVAIVAVVVIAKRGEQPGAEATVPRTIERAPIDFERFRLAKLDKEDPDAKSRISIGEIRFDQVRGEPGALRGSIGAVVARLYNDSAAYTLIDYEYDLKIQDCIKLACTTIFDQHGLSAVSVPPHQARDVRIAIQDQRPRDVAPTNILGTANILLAPTSTRAKVVSDPATD